MKKLFAILLLSVYLFNLAGYSLWFQYLITKSDSQFTSQLDKKHYNNEDLVEVKVPLNMPYITNSGNYERVDGQLEYNGTQYSYVQKKIANDTLYILCLPNASRTQLYNAKAAFSKEVNDLPAGKKSNESNKKAGFDTDYKQASSLCFFTEITSPLTVQYPLPAVTRLATAFLSIPEQPPKQDC